MTRPCSYVSLLALCLLAAPLFAKGGYTVTVANPLDEPRAGEMVEVAASSPDRPFTYYWGADWSKAGRVADFAAWQSLAQSTLRCLRSPLTVTVTPE